jgi:hypothetical protein
MFQAVRSWWRSARGQRTVRLFGFELAVVMVGVLAAQQVSNWAQKRSALSQVEGVKGDLFHAYSIYRTISHVDLIAIPCLEQRIDLILQLAASRRPVDGRLLASAQLAQMGPDVIAPADEQLLRERYGDTVTDQITSVQYDLRIADDAFHDLDRNWFEFERIDPRHGRRTEGDFAAVREAAIRSRGDLSLLRKSVTSIDQLAGSLGIATVPNPGFRAVSNCEEIWTTGRAYRGH